MLTQDQVIEIFKSLKTTKELTEQFNVSSSVVTCIKRRKYYKHYTTNIGQPGSSSKRIPLTEETVIAIYDFDGTIKQLKTQFNCSALVARNIKFGNTYYSITGTLNREPGELKIYNLSWDQICDIKASDKTTSELAIQYKVHSQTIRNIQNEKTRKYS